MRGEIETGPVEICICGNELRLVGNLKRNIQIRGEGYRVKYERSYQCDYCSNYKVIRSNGETWRPPNNH
jgi:hypothetical protein